MNNEGLLASEMEQAKQNTKHSSKRAVITNKTSERAVIVLRRPIKSLVKGPELRKFHIPVFIPSLGDVLSCHVLFLIFSPLSSNMKLLRNVCIRVIIVLKSFFFFFQN